MGWFSSKDPDEGKGHSMSDKDVRDFLSERGVSRKEADDAQHQANDDMMDSGWMPERQVQKYLDRWGTEEDKKEWRSNKYND